MKLLLDMNLSPMLAHEMTAAGFETVHWSAVGAFNATDPELMAYASDHGFVVVTHDLDFGAILAASGAKKPSVLQLRTDNLSTMAVRVLLVSAIKQSEQILRQGALLIVDTQRNRIRVLPLTTQ